ncbi:hypothetical protein GP486_008562, partial [Trichoglossum hirsutum]
MALFTTEVRFPDAGSMGEILVHHRAPGESQAAQRTLHVPLQPEVEGLQEVTVSLHQSATTAYDMGTKYNNWFSECLGYDVMLVYLGGNLRPVLGNVAPKAAGVAGAKGSSWISTIMSSLLFPRKAEEKDRITFADVAQFLVVTEASLDDVSSRLAGDLKMDITKFRPNIVLSGSHTPWDEDFWGELTINTNDNSTFQMPLTQNCPRCQSINVDYATGGQGA